jgi:hypothetical protein
VRKLSNNKSKRILWNGKYKPFYKFTFIDDYIVQDFKNSLEKKDLYGDRKE